MRIFGLTIGAQKAADAAGASAVDRGGWFAMVREAFAGAWQRNVEIKLDRVMTFSAVYACVTLIASDIGKMRIRLVEEDGNGIWNETTSPSFSPVLRKPNSFQNRIEFFEHWITSKLIHGNAYVLKERDARNVIVGLCVLDPNRVKPLVAPDGSVFYEVRRDHLAGITAEVLILPASEIIHDRMHALYHPLVGIPPIHACGLAATQGLRIQTSSARFFENNAAPGGILTAPGRIDKETAERLKQNWAENYSGDNVGKVAIAGDGLTFQQLTIPANQAQLIEQLKWTAETVCSCFKVPAYKVGVGAAPLNNNVEALDQQYYSQCLQILIEKIELCLDEGLALPGNYGAEFDLDGLLRMDTATQITSLASAVGAALMSPDEGRKRINLPPVPGGDTPYLQEQNWPLKLLAGRDVPARAPTAPAVLPPPANDADEKAAEQARFAIEAITKGFAYV